MYPKRQSTRCRLRSDTAPLRYVHETLKARNRAAGATATPDTQMLFCYLFHHRSPKNVHVLTKLCNQVATEWLGGAVAGFTRLVYTAQRCGGSTVSARRRYHVHEPLRFFFCNFNKI